MAIVTGANSGIGAAFAAELASQGYNIAHAGRWTQALELQKQTADLDTGLPALSRNKPFVVAGLMNRVMANLGALLGRCPAGKIRLPQHVGRTDQRHRTQRTEIRLENRGCGRDFHLATA